MAFFSPESKLYKAISFIGNLLALNGCWLLFSLPLVSVGASTVAAYSVAFKLIEGKEEYIFRDFLKAFKENWKHGTILWIITAVAVYGFYLDIQILQKGEPGIPVIVISIVAFVAIVFALVYAYPLSARYENKVLNHIRNSFLLCFAHLGKTLVLMLILVLEIGILLWNIHTLIFIVIIGPGLLIYTTAGTARKIFALNDEKNKSA